jgi:peptide/nickel transport system permease protein
MVSVARYPERPIIGGHRLGRTEMLGLIILLALLGPCLWRQGPLDQHIDSRLQSFSLGHPLGTDRFGRGILARLLTGARWSLTGAAIVCLGTSALGFLVGVLAATGSRVIDGIIGRAVESLLATANFG